MGSGQSTTGRGLPAPFNFTGPVNTTPYNAGGAPSTSAPPAYPPRDGDGPPPPTAPTGYPPGGTGAPAPFPGPSTYTSALQPDVHTAYYDPAYNAPRGCCGMPVSFWLFALGIIFPIFWLCGLCCLFSRNPYERVWAKAILFSLMIYAIVGLVLGILGGLGWGRG